jgi:hypothetical protein
MLKKLLLTVTALLFIACNIQKKDTNIPDKKEDVIASGTNSMNDYEIGEPERYILDENTLKDIADAKKALETNEIKDIAFKALLLSENILSGEEISAYEDYKSEVPMGTYFWDEFSEYETQYNLADNESKLLGTWINTAMNTSPYNRRYIFFPNKFFVLGINSDNYIFIDNENKSLYRAAGTWEITDSMVKITIYSIEIEDDERSRPNNKDIVLLEHPYTFDFINIDDIDVQGYTKKPAYDRILSEELQRQVRVKVPNRTNNLYLRNVYSIDWIPLMRKNYNYFTYFPEMAKEKHTGLEIAVNPELTKKYIPVWMIY